MKYFNGFQNQNFSVLWLIWIQRMELKQNQTFLHGTYSNLTSYIIFSKNKSFNDFQNQNLSVLWLKWTQTMEIKQNPTLSMRQIQIWHHFSLVAKYLNIWVNFILVIFQFQCKSEDKQLKWNKMKWDMDKSDSNFLYLQISALFKWLLKFTPW